jgi:phosphoribosyl-dephospho-CoA transferase
MGINVHDLLTFTSSSELRSEYAIPAWVNEAVDQTKRVVVRRAVVKDGLIPVGVRGELRHQRYAAYLPVSSVVEIETPIQLSEQASWRTNWSKDNNLAFTTLQDIAFYYGKDGVSWGPTGSIGFELASGFPVVHPNSDLDIAIYAPQRVERKKAAAWNHFNRRLPVDIDALLETPIGACSLREYVSTSPRILLRTKEGPRLVRCPWDPQT